MPFEGIEVCTSEPVLADIYLYIFKSTILFIFSHLLGGGSGNPLQYSCLENPMDGGVW